ncbi:MAG TPA: hypothetical protein VF623_09970 [Segetibacter sp.]|jgi:uncharacterized protein YfbU (UPF0304 family)
MKKVINTIIIGLVATVTTTFAQPVANTYNNHYLSAETRFNNNTLSLADIKKKNAKVELAKTADTKTKAEKKAVSNNLQFSSFLTNTNATSYAQAKKLTDGTFAISVKEATSSVGKIAVKEANIIYDNQGIVSINMNIDKQKGKAFIDANLKKYGHPNNENVLDNFSWIIGEYVLEVQESNTNFTAIYKKSTAANQYLNEGVAVVIF